MPLFGTYSLLLALVLGAYAFLAGGFALFRTHPTADGIGETARRAGIGVFIALTCSAAALVTAAFQNDFSVSYILRHSNIELPAPYKFAVLWSGQEGSLLFWAWLLAMFGFIVRLRWKLDPRLVAYAGTIIAAVQLFFLLLLNLAAHPFSLVQGAVPPDGNGLNPLLQYWEMVIHPPMLYLGYVGFTVPFAFALGALIMRYPGEKWIWITRRWTMVTWGFLTCGIFLGSHWAYSVLGWGGYWGWDPVENASLLPWLTGTAFLHSVMMQEKRGMMKSWNLWLIFTTFLLSILGTFLTRSGVVSSVHAFAQSDIGNWFLVFLVLSLAACTFFYAKNRTHLRSEHKLEALVSRESSFLFNNLVFLIACFTVLWGTLFPILSEWVQGHKITVGPPFFNRVLIPIGIFLLILTGVGPLLAWRNTSFESVKRNFRIPLVMAALTAVVLMALGIRPWSQGGDGGAALYSLMTFLLAALVVACIASEFYRGARVISGKTNSNLFAAAVQLTRRNTRRYGGYIVHFGVVLVFIGFAGAAFNQETEKEIGFGDEIKIGSYTLVGRSFTDDDNSHYASDTAILDVYKNGKPVATMYPERRFFKANQQPSTIVANRSTLKEDLYLVYAGKNQETDRPIIKAHLNPLVAWIWIGFFVIIAGTGVALAPNAATIKAVVPKPAAAAATAQAETVGAGD